MLAGVYHTRDLSLAIADVAAIDEFSSIAVLYLPVTFHL
jgi:hypothetical protein